MRIEWWISTVCRPSLSDAARSTSTRDVFVCYCCFRKNVPVSVISDMRYWRRLSRFRRPVLTLFAYITVYVVLSYAFAPKATVTFLSEEFRVGDKYAFVYLDSPSAPVFTDADGAHVFESRQCERCFVTNNIGFLPPAEYDAILVTIGDEKPEMPAKERERRYRIETSDDCIRKKFKRCSEPKITSLNKLHVYNLCEFCAHLHSKKKSGL